MANESTSPESGTTPLPNPVMDITDPVVQPEDRADAPMTEERARQIMKLMFAWCMYDIVVEDKKPEPIPDDITLRDMLDANDFTKAERGRKMKHAKETGEKVSFGVSIDPRGIAALYTAMHFDANHGNTVASHGDKFVMVLSRKRLEAMNTNNEDE